jgi:glucan phosphoethanolaminetransferase (alkaline phosphatase superfamily)
MKSKKANVKKILYIVLIVVLALIFVASLTFGSIAAFTNDTKESIEVWYSTKYEKDFSLLKQSIIWLIISATLLTITLSFKDFKAKYID